MSSKFDGFPNSYESLVNDEWGRPGAATNYDELAWVQVRDSLLCENRVTVCFAFPPIHERLDHCERAPDVLLRVEACE